MASVALILISDRKVGNDFRDRIVSGEAKPAEHNGHIWSRASTKHGTILAGKNPRFLLGISMRHRNKIYPNGHVLYVDGGILAYIGKQV